MQSEPDIERPDGDTVIPGQIAQGEIDKRKRITPNFLTKYEKARIIGKYICRLYLINTSRYQSITN